MNFVHLVEKLDYEFDHAYTAYEISPKVRVNGWKKSVKMAVSNIKEIIGSDIHKVWETTEIKDQE